MSPRRRWERDNYRRCFECAGHDRLGPGALAAGAGDPLLSVEQTAGRSGSPTGTGAAARVGRDEQASAYRWRKVDDTLAFADIGRQTRTSR